MLIRTDTTFSAVRNVLDGTADAALANSVALEYYTEQNKDKKLPEKRSFFIKEKFFSYIKNIFCRFLKQYFSLKIENVNAIIYKN